MKRSAAARLDPDGPALVRQRARQGPTAVMKGRWRDPDDVRPTAARTAREVAFFRTYCPLRWMRERHGDTTAVTERHILAADRLRMTADAALIGLSGAREPVPILSIAYGPLSGPTAAAVRQVRAAADLRRVMLLFSADDRAMLVAVVLLNGSVRDWTEAYHPISSGRRRALETIRLVGLLDVLEAHWRAEIDEDVARGHTAA